MPVCEKIAKSEVFNQVLTKVASSGLQKRLKDLFPQFGPGWIYFIVFYEAVQDTSRWRYIYSLSSWIR